jgi:hypothetical protein
MRKRSEVCMKLSTKKKIKKKLKKMNNCKFYAISLSSCILALIFLAIYITMPEKEFISIIAYTLIVICGWAALMMHKYDK